MVLWDGKVAAANISSGWPWSSIIYLCKLDIPFKPFKLFSKQVYRKVVK